MVVQAVAVAVPVRLAKLAAALQTALAVLAWPRQLAARL
jgi:hypothetical protein